MANGWPQAGRPQAYARLLHHGQIGEIFTVLGLGTWLAAAGALSHVLNHAIMKDLLFLCAGGLIFRVAAASFPISRASSTKCRGPWAV